MANEANSKKLQEHGQPSLGQVKTSSLDDTIPYTSHTVSYLPCAKEGDKYSRLAPLCCLGFSLYGFLPLQQKNWIG